MQNALCTLILLTVALAVPHAQPAQGTPAGVAAAGDSAREECKQGETDAPAKASSAKKSFVDVAYACVGWIHDPSEPRNAPQFQAALVAVEGQAASSSARLSSLTVTGISGVANDLFSAIVAVAIERAKRDGLALVKERLEKDVCEARAPGTDTPPLLPNTCAMIRTTDLLTLVGQATALRAALVGDAVRLARHEIAKTQPSMLPPFVNAGDTGLRVLERAVAQPRFVLTKNDVWLVVDAFLNASWKKDATDTPATVAAERAVIETAVAVARVYVKAEQMRRSAEAEAPPADLAEVIRLEIANCGVVFASCRDLRNSIELTGRLRDFSLLAVKAAESTQMTLDNAPADDLRAQLRNAMDFVFSASASIRDPQAHQWMRAVALSALDGDAPHLISAIALVGADLAKGCEKDQGCLDRQKVVALLTSVSTFALSYQPIPADATAEQRVALEKAQQEHRKQAIESIVDAAADRRNRAGDRVWGLGIGVGAMLYANQHFPGFDGVLDCAKNGATSPTCNQAVDFHAPLGVSWQKLPGKGWPFHVGVSFVDLGNYLTTDQSTQQQVDWKAIFAPGLQVGIPLGKPNRFFVAGFTASYIPHFAVDETSSQVQDAWKFGFFVHYYLSLWDFD